MTPPADRKERAQALASGFLASIGGHRLADSVAEGLVQPLLMIAQFASARPNMPTRKEMKKRLERVEKAATFLAAEFKPSVRLNDGFMYVQHAKDRALPCDVDEFVAVLEEVVERARIAAQSLTKRGQGRAQPLLQGQDIERITDRMLCAIMVIESWEAIHGAEPAVDNDRALMAADRIWSGLGLSPIGRNKDEASSDGWAYWIGQARAIDRGSLVDQRSAYRRLVRSAFERTLSQSEQNIAH